MEQKEKIEKPAWVESVEKLPEIIRQQVGSTCAGVISSLVQIWMLNHVLFGDVIDAVNGIIYEQTSGEDADL